jgi:glycosyltransferase involved in cell wall biosynthesis
MTFSPRVLHVIPSVSPKRGGPSAAIFPMVQALNRQGARAEIVTTNDDGPGVNREPLYDLTFPGDVPIRFFPRFSPPLRALREYAYAGAFRAWLRQHVTDYDVLHIHALFSHLPAVAMGEARRAGVPYISRPLGQLGRWPLRQSAWRKKIHYTLVEGRHLPHAAALHYISEAERTEASPLGLRTPTVVIPHGVDLPALIPEAKRRLRAELGLPPRQKLVLFLGRWHRKKGLNFLISACAALQDSTVTLLLAGAGDAEEEKAVTSLLAQAGMGANVVRLGFVSGERKQLLLQGADVFVLLSWHENFGVAVLEAIAAGTPVLISDQVALAGQVQKFHLGTVVPMEEIAACQGLRDLLRAGPCERTEEFRAFVATHYSWRANAAALMELYAAVLTEGRANKRP